MKEIRFPDITLTVEAKPWPANHYEKAYQILFGVS